MGLSTSGVTSSLPAGQGAGCVSSPGQVLRVRDLFRPEPPGSLLKAELRGQTGAAGGGAAGDMAGTRCWAWMDAMV